MGHIGGVQVPVVGRVSMDLVTFDLSAVPAEVARPGATIDLLDPDLGVDELGARAGTIGYEILTALGRRYHRSYLGG
jgi:alanine racemase